MMFQIHCFEVYVFRLDYDLLFAASFAFCFCISSISTKLFREGNQFWEALVFDLDNSLASSLPSEYTVMLKQFLQS